MKNRALLRRYRALLRRDRVNIPLLHKCIDHISLKYSVQNERYVRQIMLWGSMRRPPTLLGFAWKVSA